MFKFLKKKIKDTVSKFKSSAEEDAQEVKTEELTKEEKTQLKVEEKKFSAQDLLDESEDELVVEETEVEEIVEDKVPEPTEQVEELEPVAEEATEEDAKKVLEELDAKPVVAEPITEVAEIVQAEINDESITAAAVAHERSEREAENDSEQKSERTEPEPIKEVEEPKKKGFLGKLFKTRSKDESSSEVRIESEQKEKEPEINSPDLIAKIVEAHERSEREAENVNEQTVTEKKPEPKPEPIPEPIPEPKSKPEPEKLDEIVDETPVRSAKHEEYASVLETDKTKDATKKKKGFFGKLKEKVVKFKLDEAKFEELFWEFELALLENNVATQIIEKIKKDLHDQLTKENVSRRKIEDIILETLKTSLEDVLDIKPIDLLKKIESKKPYIICVIGVNGSGKTTTLAKIIKLLQNNNKSVVVAASDTFRAAAIQQLEEHTTKLGVKLIKHDYSADPSAVAFDAIKHAEAKGIDVVLIDTAGRLQSNSNLMDELKKLIRVNKPDFNLFIGESITGNDCVEQAVAFNELVGIDGIILSKADIDEKGGAAISVSYVTKKPILYLGVGQTYEDLKPFKKEDILNSLGL